jgi:hypothetical protein
MKEGGLVNLHIHIVEKNKAERMLVGEKTTWDVLE